MSWTTTIIEDRWKEAVANPTIPAFRSLAVMADDLASALELHDPDNIMVPAIRGVAVDCQARMLALMPKSVDMHDLEGRN